MCNPLLDISVSTTREGIESLGLAVDSVSLATTPELVALGAEMAKNREAIYSAGGAGQNTARAVQWILAKHGEREPAVAYVGSIGDDPLGEELAKQARKDGIHTLYQVQAGIATGTCSCLLSDGNRTLVANLSAAMHFKPTPAYMEQIDPLIPHLDLVYCTGFFLSVSYEMIMRMALGCKRLHPREDNNKDLLFAFNLSATFTCQDPLIDTILPCVDILFGNEAEVRALALAHMVKQPEGLAGGKEDDDAVNANAASTAAAASEGAAPPAGVTQEPSIEDIIWWIGRTYHCPWIVITQGALPTLVLHAKTLRSFPVPPLPTPLVDSNGAGDGFCAGFLAHLIMHYNRTGREKQRGVDPPGWDLDKAINAGHQMAGIICCQTGFVLPSLSEQEMATHRSSCSEAHGACSASSSGPSSLSSSTCASSED